MPEFFPFNTLLYISHIMTKDLSHTTVFFPIWGFH